MYQDDQYEQDQVDKQPMIDEEGWTRAEKLGFVRRVLFICVLIGLCGGGAIYINIKLFLLFKSLWYL